MTGDFDRDGIEVDPTIQLYHQHSYVDTYDPKFRDEMYTNTDAPDTITNTESDYYINSNSTTPGTALERQLYHERHFQS